MLFLKREPQNGQLPHNTEFLKNVGTSINAFVCREISPKIYLRSIRPLGDFASTSKLSEDFLIVTYIRLIELLKTGVKT